MQKKINLLFCLVFLWVSGTAQTTKKTESEFAKLVKAYQILAVKEYIASGAVMGTDRPDTTAVASLIDKVEIDETGSISPEKTASFLLGWMPYQEQVTFVQWIRKDGKKILGITHQLNSENIESNAMNFKQFRILDEKLQDIKNQVLPNATLTNWQQAYQNAVQKDCDNYKMQTLPLLTDEAAEAFHLGLGRGGSKNDAGTWFIVEARFKVRNTICRLFIGELKFNAEKRLLEFRKY